MPPNCPHQARLEATERNWGTTVAAVEQRRRSAPGTGAVAPASAMVGSAPATGRSL